jgi:DNA primase
LSDLRGDLQPEKWNVKSIRRRVEAVGDLWAGFWKSRQRLESLLENSDAE